jgi:WD40 repeat protein
MAVGSFDNTVYVLDTRMMRRLYSVGRHGDKVCRAHLYDKGDSDLLMTTGWDRTVRLWQFD